MKKVRILSLILIFILVFSMTVFAEENVTSAGPEKTIQIIHTNDVHARVTENDSAGMGYAKLAALAADIAAKSGTKPLRLWNAGKASSIS